MPTISKIPNQLLKLSQKILSDKGEQDGFIEALIHPQPLSSSVLWCQPRPLDSPFPVQPPLPWQPSFCDRLTITASPRPSQHFLHQQGHFYCLDFSSVFAAIPWLHYAPVHGIVVDLCAAPGGKSIAAWVGLHPQLLLSNESIKKRIGKLISNLKRCHVTGFVSNADSQLLRSHLTQTSDLVIVDAPCTGQSLLAKGEEAPGCFHPVNIQKNVGRQRRILANAAHIVAPQGFLAYMTCTFSWEENEQVCAWFLRQFPQFQPLVVPGLEAYQSQLTNLPCYRLLPQSGLGAGAFTIVMKNQLQSSRHPFPGRFLDHPSIRKTHDDGRE